MGFTILNMTDNSDNDAHDSLELKGYCYAVRFTMNPIMATIQS